MPGMSSGTKVPLPELPTAAICHYCGDPATTWDHIIPRALYGPGEPWNLVPACEECNTVKRNHWPNHPGCATCRSAVHQYASNQVFFEQMIEILEHRIRLDHSKPLDRESLNRMKLTQNHLFGTVKP